MVAPGAELNRLGGTRGGGEKRDGMGMPAFSPRSPRLRVRPRFRAESAPLWSSPRCRMGSTLPPMSEVTQLLGAIEAGDPKAADQLLPLVYEELRQLAARKMAQERPGQTLQATALVHEAWLRLNDSTRQEWRGREHFLSAAAESMRRILVDQARRKARQRHGGQCERVDCELMDLPIAADDERCLQVSDALDQLARIDARKAEVVKMRMFVGLEVQEIALALKASEKTVQRDWVFAKAWLSRELQQADAASAGTSDLKD